jgi:tRNA-splicing ligase RtcB
MAARNFDVMRVGNGFPVKMWTRGVPVDDATLEQLATTASLPFIYKHLAVMPDVHLGKGSTVGSVIPTQQAVIPAAVGVDIGCGMMAVQTTLSANDLPDDLRQWRSSIERAVPHGRTGGARDKGAWRHPPASADRAWGRLEGGFKRITAKYPGLEKTNNRVHLGTLGTGNHFIEVCLDETGAMWILLHSGSRGVGNAIGTHFIELAKKDVRASLGDLPDQDLAYLTEGTSHFDDYVEAVGWAQEFARLNREVMMENIVTALRAVAGVHFRAELQAVNCHHNYVARERHFGRDVWITRKGAQRAGPGELGIIPGSMGARSYIVRGLGNPESFESCSHGAGRAMSRGEAKRRFTLSDHAAATAGVECRKDAAVLDETPAAYKDIDAVMAAQQDLVEIVHTLKQVVCVKG